MEEINMPQWQGLFNWSMQYQDGTRPTDFKAIEANPEKLKWLEGVLKNYMVDFVERMQEMQRSLRSSAAPGASPGDVQQGETLLEELQEIVESIDFAKDLQTIGGLPTLQQLARCDEPSLQWRALEVIATCCQNHPAVQAWFHQEGVLSDIVPLLCHSDTQVRAKALLASSSMVRGYQPALDEFWSRHRALELLDALVQDEAQRIRVKALHLLRNICAASPAACHPVATRQGLIDKVATKLPHEDMQEVSAALGLLYQLTDNQNSLGCMRKNKQLTSSVASTMSRLQGMTPDEKEAMREEVEWCAGLKSLLE